MREQREGRKDGKNSRKIEGGELRKGEMRKGGATERTKEFLKSKVQKGLFL